MASVGGSCSAGDLPGKWQLVAEVAKEKNDSFFPGSTTNLRILPSRPSGSPVEYQQDPRPQVARPDHESSVPPSPIAVQPLSVSRQSL